MNNIINLLDISVDKIKSMVDVNVVMGKMMTYNNVSVIPISKVKCGFISGGVDQKENQETKKNPFGGASGGTMTLTPIAFLVILENDAKVLHLDEHSHILENLIDLIPDTINKFASLIKKDNNA
ncbi:MAG: GerW family sporulation protein [Bacilli bacterium]|jgi:sporulation protein ytfJ|nr:sporulation protein YtfJ [Staphylococcus sp.]